MSDFFQNGAIATLHGLGTRSLSMTSKENSLALLSSAPWGWCCPPFTPS